MGILATDSRQATLIYYPGSPIDDDITAYAASSKKKMNIIDLSNQNLTGTQWAEIAEGLGKELKDLINTKHPKFREKYKDTEPDLDNHDWIDVLTNTPQVLSKFILINGNTYHEIDKVSQFVKFMDNDSAGLDKPYPNPQEK